MSPNKRSSAAAVVAVLGAAVAASNAQADFVINDDLIVDGSACVGLDCVNGESFGFDTIRLKENNLRIKFDDTSTAASFPRTDWQILVNDSANGGLSRFSIEDVSGGRIPFTVEANAPSHSLYVDNGGRLGLGTNTPALQLDIKDGDTPSVRLQQDGSVGWTPQTWDLAGNEANFFVRDVTNGSSLPFRIRPGAASSSLEIASDGNVGIGTSNPGQKLTVLGNAQVTADVPSLFITNTGGATDNKTVRFRKFNFGLGQRFSIDAVSDDLSGVDTAYAFVRPDGNSVSEHQFYTGGAQSLTIDGAGNVALRGGTTFGPSSVGTLNLFSAATSPTGSPADGVIVYAEDVGGSAELRVRDEAGNVTTLSPHNFEGFEPDPDDPFPWSYHSRNPFLGQEIWVDMSGAIRAVEKLTGQTFIHRRAIERADWAKAKQAEADAVRERRVLEAMREEVEVAKADAIEPIEVTETVESEETETVYKFDPETGEVVATKRPVMVERPTGERRMRIRAGVRLDERTGKFYRFKTRKEAEAAIAKATAQPMPKWIAKRAGKR